MAAPRPVHKTKQRLLDAALGLLDTHAPQDVSVEMVLTASGVSSGSLYHHFDDLRDLLDQATVIRYTQFARTAIEGLGRIIAEATSAAEAREAIHALMEHTHSEGYRPVRTFRAWVAAQAAMDDRLAELLGREQARLTADFTGVVELGQSRGFVQPDLDPMSVSVFVQAYTVGRVVDDISNVRVDDAHWVRFMQHMVDRAILVAE